MPPDWQAKAIRTGIRCHPLPSRIGCNRRRPGRPPKRSPRVSTGLMRYPRRRKLLVLSWPILPVKLYADWDGNAQCDERYAEIPTLLPMSHLYHTKPRALLITCEGLEHQSRPQHARGQQCNDTALERGPHKSSHGEREFVASEMLDFCGQGYRLVLPYHEVWDLSGLHLSPLRDVPQRDWRPRLIFKFTISNVSK